MPSEMSAVWRVRHIFHACGIKAVVVSVAAVLPIQSVGSMIIFFCYGFGSLDRINSRGDVIVESSYNRLHNVIASVLFMCGGIVLI
jgi:hypothetical protein